MFKLLDGENLYTEVMEKGILRARSSVAIATANVKDMHVMLEGYDRALALPRIFEELVGRRIEVKLLHGAIPSQAFLEDLSSSVTLRNTALFDMRRCIRVHMKAVIIDNRKLYMGSANLTGAGLGMKSAGRRNFEVGILTDSIDMVDKVADIFYSIWEGVNCGTCGRRDVCVAPLETPFD
ncbi:MAG: phospholipase [Candidatus Wallbacteria bacterium HGW-Wallbacteria-1]|jgi:phosphatidylserine/phosphatidylglycerophosphate/cardiolipin synthase-like enzyme|uniref:Phospholipase n=1 Tax=Candidatus Wallbacteria bacterium HGW-Wallbacteria-1 TaxID=2013854 RepID=A0A2N1PRK4_9BACT|nr:MAG: phospholipase [Candidatus Wallbacteria bacterium HGW-Wallbacteria-1]